MNNNIGQIVKIIDPVVDVHFPTNSLPNINDALLIKNTKKH